jgi:hypothetical protein
MLTASTFENAGAVKLEPMLKTTNLRSATTQTSSVSASLFTVTIGNGTRGTRMPTTIEALRTVLKTYDAAQDRYYAAWRRESAARNALSKREGKKEADEWNASVAAREEAQASLKKMEEEIEQTGWGPAVRHYNSCDGKLTEEDIAFWAAEYDRAHGTAA